jgi:hypothetical protein
MLSLPVISPRDPGQHGLWLSPAGLRQTHRYVLEDFPDDESPGLRSELAHFQVLPFQRRMTVVSLVTP